MAPTAAQARSKKTRPSVKVRIILNQEWGEQLGEYQVRVDLLKRDVGKRGTDTSLIPEIDELTDKIQAMIDQADEEILEVKMVGLPAERYERLVRAHPPTKEQRQKAAAMNTQVAFNEDTFPVALVQACWKSPRDGWSNEDIAELWNAGEEDHEDDEDAPAGARWNSAELGSLFMGAQQACMSRNQVG